MADSDVNPFDMADYLNDPETIAEYLRQAMESNDKDRIAVAFGTVARAIGVTELTRQTGLSRTQFYSSFAAGGNPSLASLTSLANAFGVRLSVVPPAAA